MLSLKGNGDAAPATALPPRQEQGGSENALDHVEPESGPHDAAQQDSLGSSLTEAPYLKTCNSSDNFSPCHGENQQNPCDILSGVDDPQRPLHIVWPHRW